MKQVTLIAIPGALGSALTIALEMLSAANDIARAGKDQSKVIELNIVSASPELKVELYGGLKIECAKSIQDISHSELIFLPGVWGNPLKSLRNNEQLSTWLVNAHENGSIICSSVTGSYFLAEAGLLNDRVATTHWRFFDHFEKQYPKVKLQRKRFITSDKGLYCTGSINAIRDLILHLIEQLFGEPIRNEVSRHFSHELKRSFESMLLNEDQRSSHHDEEIMKIQDWIQLNFQSKLQISKIAQRFGLSVRSLNRRFKLATNATPLDYLQDVRIGHAMELLKQSNLNVSEVAHLVGYQDASYFSDLFKKHNSVTPHEYRNVVRTKLFLAETNQQLVR